MSQVFNLGNGRVWRQSQSYRSVKRIVVTSNPITISLDGKPGRRGRRLFIDGHQTGRGEARGGLFNIDIITDEHGAYVCALAKDGSFLEVAAPVLVVDGVEKRGSGFDNAPPLSDEAFHGNASFLVPKEVGGRGAGVRLDGKPHRLVRAGTPEHDAMCNRSAH